MSYTTNSELEGAEYKAGEEVRIEIIYSKNTNNSSEVVASTSSSVSRCPIFKTELKQGLNQFRIPICLSNGSLDATDGESVDIKINPCIVDFENCDQENDSDAGSSSENGANDSSNIVDHRELDSLLKTHVSSSGKVNYTNFKRDESKLESYLNHLDSNPPADNWSKQKRIAYWINIYNATTIKLILENHPVNQILDLHNGSAWKVNLVRVGGNKLTLDHVEKEILIRQLQEPRVHFAVNCAAVSCPPLANQAWTEQNLENMLEERTRSFINDANQNNISSNSIRISRIFEWYKDDFGSSLTTFLNRYSRTTINSNATISYLPYNWDLND